MILHFCIPDRFP